MPKPLAGSRRRRARRPPDPEYLPGTSPRRRRRRRVLALAAVSTLLALVVSVGAAEWYLRSQGAARFPALSTLYDFYENDGDGGVRLIAGYRGEQVVEGRSLGIAINSAGMRGPEIGPRRSNEHRVLFLGDSIPFGHGVAAEEAFPALTERLLRAAGLDVTVGNAGVPGASHHDQRAQFRRHQHGFDADVIVSCVYTGNDFDGDFFGPKTAIDGYWFGTAAARLIEGSWRARLCLHSRTAYVLENFLTENLPALAMDRSLGEPTAEEAARHDLFEQPPYEGVFMDKITPAPVVEVVLDGMADTLRALQQQARNAELVVLIVPSFVETWRDIYSPALKHASRNPEEYQRGLGAKRLAERCAELGIRCMDMTPAMASQRAPNSLYLPTDLHLSVQGNAFVAEQLTPLLQALLAGSRDNDASPAAFTKR